MMTIGAAVAVGGSVGVVNRNLTRCDRNDPSYRRVLSQYCGPVITLLTQAID